VSSCRWRSPRCPPVVWTARSRSIATGGADAESVADSTNIDAELRGPLLTVEDDEGNAAVPDFDCLGSREWPTPVGESAFVLPVVPFGAPPSARVPDATVQFFSSGQPAADGSCTAPDCREVTADAAGEVRQIWPDGTVLNYRVKPISGDDPSTSFMPTVEFNLLVEQDGRPEGINTMSRAVLSALAQSVSVAFDDQKALLAGTLRDCAGRPVRGAVARVFDGVGSEVTRADGTLVVYFDGEQRPGLEASQGNTDRDGRYSAINVPTGDVRVELWGTRAEGDQPQLIACELAAVYGDTMTIVPLQPLRADAPASCGTR
jgi:hypothetical protein